jgi:Ion transport protein
MDAGHKERVPPGILLSNLCSLEASAEAAEMLEEERDEVVAEFALGMSTSSLFRAICIKIASHYIFNAFMMLSVFVSCGAMIVEGPSLKDGSTSLRALNIIHLVLSIIFALECGLKIVAYSPKEYFRKHVNKIDAFIVLISFLLMVVEESSFSGLRSLRVLRALKAIRIATRSEAMRHQVSLIITSLAAMVCSSLSCMHITKLL